MALESFFAARLENPSPSFFRFIMGLTPEERTNLALEEKNLPELLGDSEKRNMAHFVLKTKGNFLLQLLESRLGREEFNSFLKELLESNRFRKIPDSQFVSGLHDRFGFDFSPYIENWYNSKELPGFLTGSFTTYKVLDGDRERYQVKFRISNLEPTDGLIKITFLRRGRRGGGRFRFMFGRGTVFKP